MTTPFQPLSNQFYSIPKAQILYKPEGADGYELLGDADDVSIELAVEVTERYTNEDGTRKKVLSLVNQVDATMAMTLVQLTDRNRALSLLGQVNYFTQTAAVDQIFNVTDVEAGKLYKIPAVSLANVTVTDGELVPVSYVLDVNYKIDLVGGTIQILSKPVGAGDDLEVEYDQTAIVAGDQKAQIGIAAVTENTGAIIIRGTNEQGPRVQVVLHKVQLRPAGGRNYISETDLDTIELEGDILVDETQPAGLELGYEQRLDQ